MKRTINHQPKTINRLWTRYCTWMTWPRAIIIGLPFLVADVLFFLSLKGWL